MFAVEIDEATIGEYVRPGLSQGVSAESVSSRCASPRAPFSGSGFPEPYALTPLRLAHHP
ncbi:hypothetical protein [Mesorhizobium sp.]|uniref:hypothetical protein n=1 Tax=Mesorhizobium sp. TaxID=1871066 RepID=UPI0025F58A74|nr:hypothetical protein [Mesorhizobium sp.]